MIYCVRLRATGVLSTNGSQSPIVVSRLPPRLIPAGQGAHHLGECLAAPYLPYTQYHEYLAKVYDLSSMVLSVSLALTKPAAVDWVTSLPPISQAQLSFLLACSLCLPLPHPCSGGAL